MNDIMNKWRTLFDLHYAGETDEDLTDELEEWSRNAEESSALDRVCAEYITGYQVNEELVLTSHKEALYFGRANHGGWTLKNAHEQGFHHTRLKWVIQPFPFSTDNGKALDLLEFMDGVGPGDWALVRERSHDHNGECYLAFPNELRFSHTKAVQGPNRRLVIARTCGVLAARNIRPEN